MRLRHIFICGLPCSNIFFPLYLVKGRFSEKKSLNKKRVSGFYLQLLSEIFFVLKELSEI